MRMCSIRSFCVGNIRFPGIVCYLILTINGKFQIIGYFFLFFPIKKNVITKNK